MREDYSNYNFSFAGNAAKAQQRLLVVFSQADLDHYENVGSYQQLMTVFSEDTPMTGLTEQLMELKDLDSLYQGETLAELAQTASLDPKQFEETISTYNESCKKGFDEEYGKPAKYLHALEEGPFYALECGALYYGTGGTMKVATKCECVDDEFNVVPGLYAVGTDAGGLLGDSYDGNEMPCSMSAWVLNSGRIAARNIAEYLKK